MVPLPCLDMHVLVYIQHAFRLQTGWPAYNELPALLYLLSVTSDDELAQALMVSERCQHGMQRSYAPAWVHANFQLGRDKKQAFLAQHAVWKVCHKPDSCCKHKVITLSHYLLVTCRESAAGRHVPALSNSDFVIACRRWRPSRCIPHVPQSQRPSPPLSELLLPLPRFYTPRWSSCCTEPGNGPLGSVKPSLWHDREEWANNSQAILRLI